MIDRQSGERQPGEDAPAGTNTTHDFGMGALCAACECVRPSARRGHTGVVTTVLALVLFGGLLALVILTGLGAHRRGLAAPPASLAGLFFPITWIVWYLRDEHPYSHARRHAE